jgi:hypothetical protein
MIHEDFFAILDFHLFGEFATGRIARFLRHGYVATPWNGIAIHSASLRLALHPKNRALHPVQLLDLGL